MALWKRKWKRKNGSEKVAYVADYYDQDGDRHIKTFDTKTQARDYLARVSVSIKEGTHVAPSKSITVGEAADAWTNQAEADGLERATVEQYRTHVRLHIRPAIGAVKLSDLTPAVVRQFDNKLRDKGLSPAMRRKVIGSLGSMIADAIEHGKAAKNPVRELSKKRRKGKGKVEKRHSRKLKVGVDLPTPEEAKAIISGAKDKWSALLKTAALTGLRASELRGLRWRDVDFANGKVHVCQRADRYGEIGSPKSETSSRSVTMPSPLQLALKQWKLARKDHKRDDDLVFGNGHGNPESHANIINRGLKAACVAGGITVIVRDADGNVVMDKGKPKVNAKYTGMHTLRHFFASWCLAPVGDGGLGYTLKKTSALMGHSNTIITATVYEHLMPSNDDGDELDSAATSLIG